MSLVDCIEYEMHSRGSLPTLYNLEGRVIGRFRSSYMVSIYKEYDIYHIRTDLPSSPRCLLIALWCMQTRTRHHRPLSYGLDLPWWCGPCPLLWAPRVIPPTASPRAYYKIEQHLVAGSRKQVKRTKSPCLALDIGVKFGECRALKNREKNGEC